MFFIVAAGDEYRVNTANGCGSVSLQQYNYYSRRPCLPGVLKIVGGCSASTALLTVAILYAYTFVCTYLSQMMYARGFHALLFLHLFLPCPRLQLYLFAYLRFRTIRSIQFVVVAHIFSAMSRNIWFAFFANFFYSFCIFFNVSCFPIS